MLGESATPESVAALSARLGLDRPALVRYGDWMKGLATGELGTSIAYDTPIAQLVGERLVVTVPLALMAMLLTTALAFSLGLFAASRHGRAGDVGVMSVSQVGIALPNFWFAILLIWLFAVKLRWFSAGGFPGWSEADGGGAGPALRALVLPAVALAVVQAAILARIVRSAVLDVLREDFVRTARAKGQSPRGVLWGHVLRNAMVPVLTVMGLQFANLLTGTVVIEQVFALPGLGRLVFQAIANRDLLGRPQRRHAARGDGRRHQLRGRRALRRHRPAPARAGADDVSAAARGEPGRRAAAGWHRAGLRVGATIVASVVGLALLSYVWTPHPATELDIPHKLQAPSASHWLGTDSLGRDIVSLLIVGSRVSIAVGLIAVGIGIAFGVALGLLAAVRRGWVEEVVMRLADFTFAFPALLSAIMLTAIYGPGLVTSIVAIGIFNVPVFARITRASALVVRSREFVTAARALGKGEWRITFEHVLPNIAAILIVQATIQFALAILAEAALSYLGLGTQPPTPSWGRMLNEAQQQLFQAPQLAVYPGVAIALTVLGLNLLGDGLRDRFDPRLIRR